MVIDIHRMKVVVLFTVSEEGETPSRTNRRDGRLRFEVRSGVGELGQGLRNLELKDIERVEGRGQSQKFLCSFPQGWLPSKVSGSEQRLAFVS